MHPALPPEFVQPDEFERLTGSRQRATWRRWLDRQGVRYIQSANGTPLVYRTRLSPDQPPPASAAVLNLEALRRGPRRAAQGR